MKRLDFAPKSPFHDLDGFIANIKKAHPAVTDHGVERAIKRALDGYNPRHAGRVHHLYGADIMTATVEDIPAWPHITPPEQDRIREHPVDAGERIDPDTDPGIRNLLQMELAGRLDRRTVHRSVLISPRGLQCSYVWRQSTGWVQEVTDHDYRLILAVQGHTHLFRDPDIHGPYVDVRSYAGAPVTERHETRSQSDVDALMRDYTRRPTWSGADLS